MNYKGYQIRKTQFGKWQVPAKVVVIDSYFGETTIPTFKTLKAAKAYIDRVIARGE